MASRLSRLPQGRCQGPHTWLALGDIRPEDTLAQSDRAATGNRQVVRGGAAAIHAGLHRPGREGTRFLLGAYALDHHCPHGKGQRRAGLPRSAQSSWHAQNQRRAEAPQEGQPGCSHSRLKGSTGRRASRSPAMPSPGRLAGDSPGGSVPHPRPGALGPEGRGGQRRHFLRS